MIIRRRGNETQGINKNASEGRMDSKKSERFSCTYDTSFKARQNSNSISQQRLKA
jgi:hypothetical protein